MLKKDVINATPSIGAATVGRHLLLELVGCEHERLGDRDFVRECMLEAAQKVGATIITDVFHQFSPTGVSGVVVIAESHFSVHTWPKAGYVAVDAYTCGAIQPGPVADFLSSRFSAQKLMQVEIVRGVDISPNTTFDSTRTSISLRAIANFSLNDKGKFDEPRFMGST